MIRKFALLFLIFLMILTAVNVIAEEEFVSISVSPYVLLGNDAEIEVDEHLISFTAEIIHFGEEKTETVCEMNYPDENTQGRKLVISKEYLTVKNGLYYLNIDNVKTDEGYNFAGDKSHYGFAVLKTAPTKLTIIASTSKPRLSDTAAFWAYSPNIDESISVCFEDETLSDININWSFVRWVFEATGKESVYAVAIDKNGKETKSSSLDLTITSVGSLGTVDWTVNPVIPTKDDDLSITIRPTAEQKAITNVPLYYELIVYDMDDNWNKSAYSCWKSFWQGADDPEQAYMSLIGDSGTLVVKAQEHADNDDPILNPDHHYRIDAYVYTPGYEEAHASQFMFISGAKGENAPVLKINGESGETVEVQARKDFRLQVTLPQTQPLFEPIPDTTMKPDGIGV